jgi:hypothetical protein
MNSPSAFSPDPVADDARPNFAAASLSEIASVVAVATLKFIKRFSA